MHTRAPSGAAVRVVCRTLRRPARTDFVSAITLCDGVLLAKQQRACTPNIYIKMCCVPGGAYLRHGPGSLPRPRQREQLLRSPCQAVKVTTSGPAFWQACSDGTLLLQASMASSALHSALALPMHVPAQDCSTNKLLVSASEGVVMTTHACHQGLLIPT